MGCASSTVEVAEGEVYAIKMSGAKRAERSEYEVSKYEEPNIEDTDKEEGTVDKGGEKRVKGISGDKGIGPGFDPVVWHFWCCRFCSAWKSCDGEFLLEKILAGKCRIRRGAYYAISEPAVMNPAEVPILVGASPDSVEEWHRKRRRSSNDFEEQMWKRCDFGNGNGWVKVVEIQYHKSQ